METQSGSPAAPASSIPLSSSSERKRPSVLFPPGIGPPIKKIVVQRIVNGWVESLIEHYPTITKASLINWKGWTAEEFRANGRNESAQQTNENVDDTDTNTDSGPPETEYINLDIYIKEQEELIAKQNKLFEALDALPDKITTRRDLRIMNGLTKWVKEIQKRRNRPSKDWVPFTRNYELLFPQFANQSED